MRLGLTDVEATPGRDLDVAQDAVAPETHVEALDRGFDGDPARLRRFVSALEPALPPETTIALRGSAVAGRAYKSGEPFDGDGPRTSDLDVVLIGDPVVDLWVPEAQLLGGINTLPLWDGAAWVAPGLDGARRCAQEIAGRPVSIQAMAAWFLELRTVVQGQPYVVLNGDS
jgi:hypothetical protein